MSKCRHNYRLLSRTTLAFYKCRKPKFLKELKSSEKTIKIEPCITFKCKKCGNIIKREMTTEEKRKYAKEDRKAWKKGMQLHKVWHKFLENFFDRDKHEWKYVGYDFMCKVEKYARRNKSIVVTSCDDNIFTGASLVLVPHKSATEYMGTTVLFISQANVQPTEFFLYPGDEKEFLAGLKKVKRKK